MLAQPKQRRGRGAAKPPLRELGPDPVSGKPMVLKEGRFGPYVTDGETNASLRRGDDPETVTVERGGRAARRPALERARRRSASAAAARSAAYIRANVQTFRADRRLSLEGALGRASVARAKTDLRPRRNTRNSPPF